MKLVDVDDAPAQLSTLINLVEQGEEVIIERDEVPIARIVPFELPLVRRKAGMLRHQIWMSDDFDEIPPEFGPYVD